VKKDHVYAPLDIVHLSMLSAVIVQVCLGKFAGLALTVAEVYCLGITLSPLKEAKLMMLPEVVSHWPDASSLKRSTGDGPVDKEDPTSMLVLVPTEVMKSPLLGILGLTIFRQKSVDKAEAAELVVDGDTELDATIVERVELGAVVTDGDSGTEELMILLEPWLVVSDNEVGRLVDAKVAIEVSADKLGVLLRLVLIVNVEGSRDVAREASEKVDDTVGVLVIAEDELATTLSLVLVDEAGTDEDGVSTKVDDATVEESSTDELLGEGSIVDVTDDDVTDGVIDTTDDDCAALLKRPVHT
jgi:hypothetical protein